MSPNIAFFLFLFVLAAVSNFEVSEEENKIEKEAGLASLFYWFPQWTDTQLFALNEVLSKAQPSLAQKIASIIRIR